MVHLALDILEMGGLDGKVGNGKVAYDRGVIVAVIEKQQHVGSKRLVPNPYGSFILSEYKNVRV
jgi:hypothetical protein